MDDSCASFALLRDAFADGQIGESDAERLRRHLAGCPSCRRHLQEIAALRRAIASLELPPAPPVLHARISAALDRAERSPLARRLTRWSTLAAAGLAVAILLFAIMPAGADVPRLVRHSSDFHDRIVSGAIRPESISDPGGLREYFKRSLGADVYAPVLGCDIDGGCVCSIPEEKLSAPWIVYRRGDMLISLLVVPDEGGDLPASARRTHSGREYYAFRLGRNAILCCRSGRTCHFWIARTGERELLDTVLATREGRKAFAGERLSLRGVT